MDIISELTKKLEEGKKKEMSLTDRLNYLDNYNKDVAVPQISSEGPKGYNPMNSLNALFSMISNRKAVSQDASNQSALNLDLLKEISSVQEKNKVDSYDTILKQLKLKQAEADLEKTNKDLGREYNPSTGMYETPKVSQASQGVLDIATKLRDSGYSQIAGLQSPTVLIPGTKAQLTKNLYNQLKSMLSLENRTKLKGSGAISDFEAKTLDKAASHLGRNLSDKEFGKVLDEMITELSGGETTASQKVGDFTIKEIK